MISDISYKIKLLSAFIEYKPKEKKMENKVLAKVGNYEITDAEIAFMLQSLNPQVASQFIGPEGEERLLQEIINQKLLLCEAVESKFEENEDFIEEFAKLKENFLSQYSVKKILGTVTVSDEEAKEFYEANPNLFVTPAQIRASHILVAEEDKANELYAKIQSGESFEELAIDNSTCPSGVNGGDLNFFSKGQMVPEFEDVAYTLEIGQISEPVKTQFGYHIIKLTEKNEDQQHSFEEVLPNIIQNLTAQKQNETYFAHIEALRTKYTIEQL